MDEPRVIAPHDQVGAAPEAQAPFIAYSHFPQAEQFLEQYLGERARVLLPPEWRENFVRYLPWVAVVFLPIHFLLVLTLLGVSAFAALLGHVSFLSGLLAVAVLACDVIALPGLFKRSRQGWTFFTYALLFGVVENLLSFSLFGLAMDVVLVWFAFQVKYRYS